MEKFRWDILGLGQITTDLDEGRAKARLFQ
jgi:hypothetical protein